MSGRVLLGWSSGSPVSRVPLSVPGDSHIITCAEPGKGKSRSVAMANLIRYPGSMVVADLNNELTKATALWRAAVLGQDVQVFDPFRIVDPAWLPKVDGEPCYAKADPLDFVRAARMPHSAAFKLAQAYIPPEGLNESHWAEGAQGYMVAKMKFVALEPLFDELDLPRTMVSVWLLLSDPALDKASLHLMATSEDTFIADQAAAFLKAGKDNREMQGIRNQIRVACGKMFAEGAILDTMTSTNVNFVQLRKRPTTIYMPLPGDLATTHSKYLNGVITMMLSTIEQDGRLPYDPQGPPPVVFQCDEFAALGRFKLIADGLARFRGSGSSFTCCFRTSARERRTTRTAGPRSWATAASRSSSAERTISTPPKRSPSLPEQGPTSSAASMKTDSRAIRAEQVGARMRVPSLPRTRSCACPCPRQLILRSGQKPVEGYLFHPSLSDFRDYGSFMYALEQGWSLDIAVKAATMSAASHNSREASRKAG